MNLRPGPQKTRAAQWRRRLSIVLAVFLLVACERLAPETPTPVYVIAVDTLRADALGVYGGAYPTPFFDELARQGVLFEQCLTPVSWTVPAMASLFTGLYPFHHGTVRWLDDAGVVLSQQALSPGYQTFAEMFRQRGYRTYGISASGHLSAPYGFAQGFDEFVTHPFLDYEAVNSSWQGMLARVAAEYRFGKGIFGFFFFFDPHHPYTPREPYMSRRHPGEAARASELVGFDVVQSMRDGIFEQRPDLAQLAAAAYDTEVAALDAYLSELAKDLPGFEKAIVVVTADHGEEFLEHGSMMHGNNLLQPQVHVPLLIRLPNGAHAGLRIAEPVSLVDVLPTLAALIGSPAPKSLDGVDLTPLWQGGRAPSRDVLLHLDVPWARHKALVRGSLKFVETEAGERSVFDVRRDPSEKTNLYRAKDETHLAVFQAIADQVQYNVRFRPRTIEAEIPDALRDKLRSLGYIN